MVGQRGFSAAITAPLTDPTSDTIVPGLQRRRDGPSDRLIGANRHAKNDAIGLAHSAGKIVGDDVAKPQRLRPLQDRDRMVGKDDAPRGVAAARGQGDRGADQPDADDRQFVEDRLGERRPSRSITFAPHEFGERGHHAPVGLLAADREPQRVRKPVGRDRPEDEAARAQEGVRIRGGAAGALGKVSSRKFPTLGVTSIPSFAIASASQGSQCELCAMARSVWATSSMLATPAACAGPFRLNGPRTRFRASRTCVEP